MATSEGWEKGQGRSGEEMEQSFGHFAAAVVIRKGDMAAGQVSLK